MFWRMIVEWFVDLLGFIVYLIWSYFDIFRYYLKICFDEFFFFEKCMIFVWKYIDMCDICGLIRIYIVDIW